MKKSRLLTYCVLLVLCFINIKVMAYNETQDDNSTSTFISAEEPEYQTDRLQLKGTDVEVNINGSIAEVTVRLQYKNNGDQIISGLYTFPMPERAMVHGMQMKTGEKTLTADVKKQETAREEFDHFKEEGKNALLLRQDRLDLFSMELANIMPDETVDVEFSYTELLIPADMRYQFVYPASTGSGYSDQSKADFNIQVNISAGIPIQELMCSSHETDIKINTDSSVKVLLKDQEKKGNNRDYVLNYRLADQKMPSGLILSGGGDENFLLLNEYVGSPGLKNVSLKFTDLKTYDLEPLNIPDITNRRPVTVIGKWKGEADGLVKVEGRMNKRNYSKSYRFVKNNSYKTDDRLQHLWAGKRIERLSDYDTENGNQDFKPEITDLGLKYKLLTEQTSLLAYNDVVRKKVTPAEEIELPSTLPEEELYPEPVRVAKVPEPGFYILVLILTSIIVAGNFGRKWVKVFSRFRCR